MRYTLFFSLIFSFNAMPYAQTNAPEVAVTVDNLFLEARFQEAIALLENSPVEVSKSLILQNKKAEALIRLGKLTEAEKILADINLKLLIQPDHFLKAVTETNLGSLQLNQGRNDLAEESLEDALIQFNSSGKPRSLEAAQALVNLGLVYMSQGKYAQAEAQLLMALSLRQNQLEETHELIAATYNDLGLVYSQTDKDKALDYFENAQRIYLKIHGKEHSKIAIANINIGIIYRDLKLYGDAVNNFETALKIWNTVYTEPHPSKALALFNLGQTYSNMNDHKAAMAYYEQSFKIYESTYGLKHPEAAYVLNAIGNLYLADGRFDDALQTYQKAIQANVQGFNNSDPKSNPTLTNYYHGTRLLHSLMFKAQAWEARYLQKSLKFKDLGQALNALAKCDSLIDALRQHSSNESDKLSLGVIADEVYSTGVRVAYEAGVNAVVKKTYFNKAFYFAEKSKSAVLLESISDANAKSFAGIPDSLLEEEKNLKSAITLTAQKLAQKPTPQDEQSLRQSYFLLNKNYEAFIKKLEDQFPEYFNLKYNSQSPSVEQLQAMLSDKAAVVSYFIDGKKNHLYVFLVRKGGQTISHRILPKDFDKYITGLRNGLYFSEVKTFRRSAYELGKVLIPKIPSKIKELIILPSGRLGIIPFETLLSRNAEKLNDYHDMPYLLKRFSVRYEFSAGLIIQKGKQTNARESPSILLCAPVTFPQNNTLQDLPGTELEVAEIANLFSAKNLSSKVFTNQQADEILIKTANLKGYNLLHFATHGVVDEVNPELSRIFFQSHSQTEDGNLFAGEIYNLQLNANLVTLSACQTGLGKILKGEGVIGLSRALVYAGAKNIVVSFWSVADESTSLFMKEFYGNLLSDPKSDYSGNLRHAKLNLLKTEKYAAPFFWAPFILIGY
ncbi:MAG: CHAT domain-containing tetratricopeptide repeat protein [Cyclobacteriaceae bacterium]